jgi:hypothetical protein
MQQQQSTDRRAARPTTAADLWRLAEQGRGNGVQIFQELSTGAWYATSASRAGALHYLTGLSCTCEGFIYAGRCQHHAMLLERLGWLPDVADDETDPEPATTPAPVSVPGISITGSGNAYTVPVATPTPVPVVDLTDERRDDLAERRHRAEQARQRLAARALDPSASDRALAACTAARAQRMATGLSVAQA